MKKADSLEIYKTSKEFKQQQNLEYLEVIRKSLLKYKEQAIKIFGGKLPPYLLEGKNRLNKEFDRTLNEM